MTLSTSELNVFAPDVSDVRVRMNVDCDSHISQILQTLIHFNSISFLTLCLFQTLANNHNMVSQGSSAISLR